MSSANLMMALKLWVAVVLEQRVQERAEHAALRCASIEGQGGGCGAAYLHSLGSACQEVQDPVTHGSVESQISELDDELGGHNSIELITEL